ncbi:hypothetical protein E2C01_054613 [Portunus trituberculatus]|uniref:Uncharacterized protein n=1 Tax=Portunus trituberculatus TaxID=210409 RepID=A0A5B7GVH4_PORTR|nr:hypothetical protein [Portunus trituberculatus]
MWAFHGNFWAKKGTFLGYLLSQSPPARKPLPRVRKSTYTQTVDRIRTRALGDPSDPKARMVPLIPFRQNLMNRDITFTSLPHLLVR